MKKLFPVMLLCLIPFLACHDKALPESNQILYVGSYTSKGSEGISVFELDQQTGALTLLQTARAENPSFLAIQPNDYLYAVSEVANYLGERSGALLSFKINPKTWELTFINAQPSAGEHPCHVTATQDGRVFVANYSSGNIAMCVAQEGVLSAAVTAQHAGSGPNADRQRGPHAHSVNLSPDERFLYAVDLGIDKIMIYDLAQETFTPAEQPFVRTAPGAGPRHFVFHPQGQFAYVINELNSTITAYSFDAADGSLAELATVPTTPPDYHGDNSGADIHITPDGRFLYGSNRGHDSLVIYRIDAQTGGLALVGHQSTLGKTPRNFAIDPSGTFLLAANQNSDNIVVFRIHPATGELRETGHQAKMSKPVCI
ncbi:lactonase family protein, partial [candidate division KSB1 bacterium]|nr:lactonase family protein [candidate division KSB1 bacterium]